jgi:hypothetical protein
MVARESSPATNERNGGSAASRHGPTTRCTKPKTDREIPVFLLETHLELIVRAIVDLRRRVLIR